MNILKKALTVEMQVVSGFMFNYSVDNSRTRYCNFFILYFSKRAPFIQLMVAFSFSYESWSIFQKIAKNANSEFTLFQIS